MRGNKYTHIAKSRVIKPGRHQTGALVAPKSEDDKNVQTTHNSSESLSLGCEIPPSDALQSDLVNDSFIKISNILLLMPVRDQYVTAYRLNKVFKCFANVNSKKKVERVCKAFTGKPTTTKAEKPLSNLSQDSCATIMANRKSIHKTDVQIMEKKDTSQNNTAKVDTADKCINERSKPIQVKSDVFKDPIEMMFCDSETNVTSNLENC